MKNTEQSDPNLTREVSLKKLGLDDITNSALLDKLHLSKRGTLSLDDDPDYQHIEGTSLSISTSGIILMESDQSKTYTFGAKDAQNPDRIVNLLIIQSKKTGEYSSFLMDYDLTETDVANIEEGRLNLLNVSEQTNLTPFEAGLTTLAAGNGAPCFETVIEVGEHKCTAGGDHSPGEKCDKPETAYYYVSTTKRMVDCPPESGSGPGGGSGGGGAGGGSTDDDNSSTDSSNNNDEDSNDDQSADETNESPVEGGNTIPIFNPPPEEEEDPCSQLKDISNDNGFSQKMNTLKGNLNGEKEKGFLISRDSTTNSYSDIVEGNDDGTIEYDDMTTDQLYKFIGSAHNHLNNNPDFSDKHLGVFTPEDLPHLLYAGSFETNADNPNKHDEPKDAVVFVITDIGFFALKIKKGSDQFQNFFNFVDSYNSKSEKEKKKYSKNVLDKKYKIKPGASKSTQIKGFLNLVKDENIGVDLYEGNPNNFNDWGKLDLDSNKTSGYKKSSCK